MLKRFFIELRDFVELFVNPQAVYARDRRARETSAPRQDWSYPR